jgi:4-amino-4-deoxy-L-arabinose transferase-like glycosyltransferase
VSEPRLARGWTRRWAVWLAVAGLVMAVAAVHLVRLDDVPRGLFVDESSIGFNAATIAERGEDEDGARFPVYFRAFGEYKNPVFIYAAAALFRLAGVSVWTLRLTSFLFFVLLVGGIAGLVRRLFPDQPAVALWAVAAAGLLPWFFTVSRIAFEVISQPAIVAWLLGLVLAVYESDRAPWWLAAACGGTLGLSIYAYSTARLLSLLFAATLLAVYLPRRYWRRHLVVAAAAGVALIPYLAFSHENPGALTHRFRKLTYVFDSSLSLGEKLRAFGESYAIYWSPRYLLIEGDFNHRNSTGAAGEVYGVVLVLALLGLGWAMRSARDRRRFFLLLALNLALAPVAAALTAGTSALRSILVGLYLLVFSCCGLALLGRTQPTRWRRVALAAALLTLAAESGRYLADYFGRYVEESVWAFKSYDFRGALAIARRQHPVRIEVSQRGNQPYAHLEFYRRTLPPGQPEVPMAMAEEVRPHAAPGVCLIYFNRDAEIVDADLYPSRVWGLDNPTVLRCFDRPAQR